MLTNRTLIIMAIVALIITIVYYIVYAIIGINDIQSTNGGGSGYFILLYIMYALLNIPRMIISIFILEVIIGLIYEWIRSVSAPGPVPNKTVANNKRANAR